MLHRFNILTHIAFGSLALLVGLGPLLGRKGGPLHGRLGRWFLGLVVVVLLSAVLGLAVFDFRPFLTAIVLLTTYQAYAGYRTAHIQATGPTRRDGLAAAVFLAGGLLFLLALPRIRLGWSPVVMHSTLGLLLGITTYDLGRYGWLPRWQRGAWRYEHIWKLVSTYGALLSAFSGNVLVRYQPYSQFVPSVLGVGLALGFMGRTYWQRRHLRGAAGAVVA
ncbi:MAG: hypothetical protein ACRYFK_13220 [Janthinobacterium lividum]